MGIERISTKLASAPALLAFDGKLERAAERGAILFFHGLGASKETHLDDLQPLAERGFLVAALDNVGHGERPPSAHELAEVRKLGWQGAFMEAVRRTTNEVPHLLDECRRASARGGLA